jgi:hypothetical protein
LADRVPHTVEASVISRWYVRNQPHLEQTDHVRDDFEEGRISLVAPDNLIHEVTGAIHQAVFARHLTARRGTEQVERFVGLSM